MTTLPLLAAARRVMVITIVIGGVVASSVAHSSAQDAPAIAEVSSVWSVDPETRSVEVEIDYDRPNPLEAPIGGVFETLPSTAVDVEASRGGRSLDVVEGETAGDFTEWFVVFANPVGPGGQEIWTLRYRLESDPADAVVHAFVDDAVVWVSSFAVGEAGGAGHRVEVPARYEPAGGTLGPSPSEVDGEVIFFEAGAGLAGYDPYIVFAVDPGGRVAEAVADAVVPTVVSPLPSDPEWAERTAEPAADILEALGEVFGSPVPFEGVVVEEVLADTLRHTATFDVLDGGELAVVRVSATASPTEIAHQLAHLWLIDAAFDEPWVVEGLAASLGPIAAGAEGYIVEASPSRADLPAELLAPLSEWSSGANDNALEVALAADEQVVTAAHVVIGSVLAEIGLPALLDAVDVLVADTITYEGAPAAEPQPTAEDWRVVLDALVQVGGSAQAPALFEELVIGGDDVASVDRWREARTVWEGLVERGAGWEMPLAVRRPMASWDFEGVDAAAAAASAVLDRRDQMADIIGAADLEVPEASRTAFESATGGMGVLVGQFDAQIGEAVRIVAATRAVGGDHGLLADVGLLGEDPDRDLDRIRELWREGETAVAADRADELVEMLDGAPGRGTVRIIVPAAFVAVVVAAYLAVRRRVQARRSALAAFSSGD